MPMIQRLFDVKISEKKTKQYNIKITSFQCTTLYSALRLILPGKNQTTASCQLTIFFNAALTGPSSFAIGCNQSATCVHPCFDDDASSTFIN